MSDVYEKMAINLVLVELPRKTTYYIGTKSLNLEGGTVCVVYDDGSYEQIPMSADMETKFDSNHEGPALVRLKYKKQEAMFQIQIQKPQIRRFIVKKPPQKTTYLSGEKLDLTGLELVVEYESNEKEPWNSVPEIDYTVEEGDAVYPLTISGITVPIYIKVNPAKLIAIRIGKMPSKTEYLEHAESFDPSGGTIIQVYDSGAEKEVPMMAKSIRGFSNLITGMQTLKVQVGPMTTEFSVNIRPKKAVRLQVMVGPAKVNYIEGQTINLDGLKLSAEYDNGEIQLVEGYNWEPKVASMDTVCVKVSVDNASVDLPIVVTARKITRISVEQHPSKMKYLEKKEFFDAEGGKIRVEYNSGNPDVIPMENSMVHGFDNRQGGECKVEVQYRGFTASFSVEITPQKLLGLLITNPPIKTKYAPGEWFSPLGMCVSGFYDSGMLQPISSYAILPDRPLDVKDVAVTISNMDKTAVVPIEVDEKYAVAKPEIPIEEFLRNLEKEGKQETEQTSEQSKEGPTVDKPKGGLAGWGQHLFYPSAAKLRGLHD